MHDEQQTSFHMVELREMGKRHKRHQLQLLRVRVLTASSFIVNNETLVAVYYQQVSDVALGSRSKPISRLCTQKAGWV